MRRLPTFLFATLLALGLTGCGGAEEEGSSRKIKAEMIDTGPSDRYDTEGLIVKSADIHDNGRASIWKIYSEKKENIDDLDATTKLVRKEVDSNADGDVDVWFHYNSLEKLFKEEADTDFNGHIDLISYYEDGRVVKRERYVQDFETPLSTRFFREGELYKIERDSNRDGRVDTWEIYAGMLMLQRGVDIDNDGRVDQWQAR